MAAGTIKRRLRLRNLSPTLRGAFEHGEITTTVAEAATRLTADQRHELDEVLGAGQRTTLASVGQIARRRTGEAAATLDATLFGESEPTSWRTTARGLLRAALTASPPSEQGSEMAQAIKTAVRWPRLSARSAPRARPGPSF